MSAKFSPSLMCMDLTQFKEQITAMNKKADFYHVDIMDKVTVMSVDPGYAGQKFIPESLNKIRKLITMRKNNGYHYLTEIDGSCNEKTFGQIAASGVDVFIVGTSGLFSLHEDVTQAWDRMIEIFQRETVAA